jgi:hypothetical protein
MPNLWPKYFEINVLAIALSGIMRVESLIVNVLDAGKG